MEIPFVFDKPVTGKQFVGRKSDISVLSNMILHGQNAALWAIPMSGKKSLVRQALQGLLASGNTFSVCEMNLGNIRYPEIFVRRFAGALLKAAAQSVDDMELWATKYFEGTSLVFDRQSYMDSGEAFPGSFALSENEYFAVAELPYLLAREIGRGMVVVLDEFQELDSDEGEKLFKIINSVMSAHKNMAGSFCTFIFMGSRVNAMESIFLRRRIFWGQCEHLPLSRHTDSEIADHVMRGFSMGGKVISRDLIQGVTDMFRGHMWHINHFFFICDALSKGYISEPILEAALSCMLHTYEPSYRAIMTGLTRFQESLLRAVLDGVVKFSTADVIDRYGLSSSANVKRLKDALMKKEVVRFDPNSDEKSEPEVLDPLFEYWLRNVYFK